MPARVVEDQPLGAVHGVVVVVAAIHDQALGALTEQVVARLHPPGPGFSCHRRALHPQVVREIAVGFGDQVRVLQPPPHVLAAKDEVAWRPGPVELENIHIGILLQVVLGPVLVGIAAVVGPGDLDIVPEEIAQAPGERQVFRYLLVKPGLVAAGDPVARAEASGVQAVHHLRLVLDMPPVPEGPAAKCRHAGFIPALGNHGGVGVGAGDGEIVLGLVIEIGTPHRNVESTEF